MVGGEISTMIVFPSRRHAEASSRVVMIVLLVIRILEKIKIFEKTRRLLIEGKKIYLPTASESIL
jgi:hypothetical protein